eukprot:1143617-Pelagomonas_calceolata.AAC.12
MMHGCGRCVRTSHMLLLGQVLDLDLCSPHLNFSSRILAPTPTPTPTLAPALELFFQNSCACEGKFLGLAVKHGGFAVWHRGLCHDMARLHACGN